MFNGNNAFVTSTMFPQAELNHILSTDFDGINTKTFSSSSSITT
jgi:hypothetical protein